LCLEFSVGLEDDNSDTVGRRASFLSSGGSFTLSAGSNRAGNDEAHLLAESPLDDAPVLGDSSSDNVQRVIAQLGEAKKMTPEMKKVITQIVSQQVSQQCGVTRKKKGATTKKHGVSVKGGVRKTKAKDKGHKGCVFHNGLQNPRPKCVKCTAAQRKRYAKWYQDFHKGGKYHQWYEKYRYAVPPRYRNKQGHLVDCNPADCDNQPAICGIPPCRGIDRWGSLHWLYQKAANKYKCPAGGCGEEGDPRETRTSTIPTKANGWLGFEMRLPATRFGVKSGPWNQAGDLLCYPKTSLTGTGGDEGSWMMPDASNCNPLQMMACSKNSITHTGLPPQRDYTHRKSALLFVKGTWCIKGKCRGKGQCPMRCYTAKRGQCVQFHKWNVMPKWPTQMTQQHAKGAYNELKAGRFGKCTPKASKAALQVLAGQ